MAETAGAGAGPSSVVGCPAVVDDLGVALVIDVDLAPDWSIDLTAGLLAAYGVPATWFEHFLHRFPRVESGRKFGWIPARTDPAG
jgi:hypothetical protein